MISKEKLSTEPKEHSSYKFQGKSVYCCHYYKSLPRQVYTTKKCISYKFIKETVHVFFLKENILPQHQYILNLQSNQNTFMQYLMLKE